MEKRLKAKVLLVVFGLLGIASLTTRLEIVPALPTLFKADIVLLCKNEYERKVNRAIGDSMYPWKLLVEMYQVTQCEVVGADNCNHWEIDNEEQRPGASCQIEYVWKRLGKSQVRVLADGVLIETEVAVRYVRRELRELTTEDRERYLSATETLYRIDQAQGEALYGSRYLSAAWLVREHLYGAASKECDHWHDDAGFLNHHVGITRQFEQSIQSIDPTVAAHYWDYTLDNSDFVHSLIFSLDWFGASSPNNSAHIVDSGRFAYTPILTKADSFSKITNPYGLLRSPWNTNPKPYLLRYQQVLGKVHDGYTLTSCKDFTEALSQTNALKTYISKLNGKLHGPIHIMIGGHWWFNNNTANYTEEKIARKQSHTPLSTQLSVSDWLGTNTGARSRALLASKFLWRQGYIRCPTTCSLPTGVSSFENDEVLQIENSCACHCPATLVGTTSAEAFSILYKSGLIHINANWEHPEEFGLDWLDILKFLCHIGHPGEMFTSAAPQDPTFWPLHGNAERFIHLVRLLAAQDTKPLDETWGYEHVHVGLDSDTNSFCDWSNHTSDLSLPICSSNLTCPGHRIDDLLPFTHLGFFPDDDHEDAKFRTNKEFYEITSPLNPAIPYVYDRITYWPACGPDQTIVS